MADPLSNVPFYGAYTAQRQMNEQQGLQDIQKIGALLQLKNAIQSQQQDQAVRTTLAGSAGDVESALNAALRAGNLGAAAKLAPLVEAKRKQGQTRIVSPGSVVLDENNNPLYTAPFKPEKEQQSPLARMIAERDALPENHPNRAAFDAAILRATEGPPKAAKETFPIVTTGDGIFERRPEGLVQLKDPKTGKPLLPTARERPITEYQGKNALYGSRAQMSDKTLTELEEKINTFTLNAKQGIEGVPLLGAVAGPVANKFLSANQQAVEQAQRNFVNAVLRQESGAVISEQEFANAKKQYFPQPGDTKKVIQQKRDNRRVAIEGFKKIAGPAWSDAPGGAQGSILEQADAILGK